MSCAANNVVRSDRCCLPPFPAEPCPTSSVDSKDLAQRPYGRNRSTIMLLIFASTNNAADSDPCLSPLSLSFTLRCSVPYWLLPFVMAASENLLEILFHLQIRNRVRLTYWLSNFKRPTTLRIFDNRKKIRQWLKNFSTGGGGEFAIFAETLGRKEAM